MATRKCNLIQWEIICFVSVVSARFFKSQTEGLATRQRNVKHPESQFDRKSDAVAQKLGDFLVMPKENVLSNVVEISFHSASALST